MKFRIETRLHTVTTVLKHEWGRPKKHSFGKWLERLTVVLE